MNKKITVTIGLIISLAVGLMLYFNRDHTSSVEESATEGSTVVYKNTQYGFNFTLPNNWKGYTVVETTWEGVDVTGEVAASGPKLLLRNPKWTSSAPYQDLPIMVFTQAQWDLYENEEFTVSAAPIPATKLSANNAFVFALPPRWDFDYSIDYKEAQKIIASNPLQGFAVDVPKPEAKLDINFVCEQALSYMTFADGSAADQFVADCKAGKHPEVIEKYKADLNLGAGVAI